MKKTLLILLAVIVVTSIVVIAVITGEGEAITPQGQGTVSLNAGEFEAFGAKWSPTGKHLAFLINQGRNTQLAVYDMRGCEVAVLVEGHVLRGTYAVSFKAEGLSSGAYVARLEQHGVEGLRKVVFRAHFNAANNAVDLIQSRNNDDGNS